jgi:hypothetical protein
MSAPEIGIGGGSSPRARMLMFVDRTMVHTLNDQYEGES